MNEKTKKLVIAVSCTVLVFAAVVGGAYWYTSSQTREYNNFVFTKQDMLWVTEAQMNGQPYKLPFYYHPSELLDIPATPDIEQPLIRASRNGTNATVFVTLSPDLPSKAVVAAVEISRLTGSKYDILNLRTHGALTKEPENASASAPRPVVTCEAASAKDTFVIQLQLGPSNVVSKQENGCIILQGETPEDLKRVADRFAYMLLGIMDADTGPSGA